MYNVKLRKTTRARRKVSIRKNLSGTAETPRLTVFRSNRYIYAQIIDDVKRVTLADVSSEAKSLVEKGNKTDAAFETGKLIATKAKKLKIQSVVFDRNGYRYHGRVQRLAEGAREGGLSL